MNRASQEMGLAGNQMSVLERQRLRFGAQQEREQLIQMEKILNYDDDVFWNEDLVKPSCYVGFPFFADGWNDELGVVLTRPKSPIEPCFPEGSADGPGKRAAESCEVASEAKMEKKKMKVCEEEESKLSEQYSNSNSKSTTTTAPENRKRPARSKSGSSSKSGDAAKTDYIHVRARRGQATDSHSLAERVRREKISERMKYLQDLVPGCHKITGKASMLDEIINYVQSLQRQVEFLSMRLAAASASSSTECYLPKAFHQSILPVNGAAVQFYLDPVAETQIPDDFLDSQIQIQQLSWEKDLQNSFASSFMPRTFR